MNVAYFMIILRREWVSLSLVMLTVCQANHRVVHEHTSLHLTKTIMLIHPCQWTDWYKTTALSFINIVFWPLKYSGSKSTICDGFECLDFDGWGRWCEDVETDHYQVIAFFSLRFHQTSQIKAFSLCTVVHVTWFLRKQGKKTSLVLIYLSPGMKTVNPPISTPALLHCVDEQLDNTGCTVTVLFNHPPPAFFYRFISNLNLYDAGIAFLFI